MTAAPVFRRSSYCQTDSCVEVATRPGRAVVRDGKDQAGPTLTFDREAWSVFLAGLR